MLTGTTLLDFHANSAQVSFKAQACNTPVTFFFSLFYLSLAVVILKMVYTLKLGSFSQLFYDVLLFKNGLKAPESSSIFSI